MQEAILKALKVKRAAKRIKGIVLKCYNVICKATTIKAHKTTISV